MRPVETWNERQGSASPTLGRHSPKVVASVLCVTAILYFAIQWQYASKIGPTNKIFSPSRTADQADFAIMIDGLSKAAHSACNGGSLNTLLFDDSDSALPYLETKGDRLGGCMVIRETNVTLFSKAEMDGCNVVFIREYEPPYADSNVEAALRTYNTRHTSPWILMERWVSNDNRFGFALYRHPCSVEKDL